MAKGSRSSRQARRDPPPEISRRQRFEAMAEAHLDRLLGEPLPPPRSPFDGPLIRPYDAPPAIPRPASRPPAGRLLETEDRRTFTPQRLIGGPQPKRLSSAPARLKVPTPTALQLFKNTLPTNVEFKNAQNVVLCERRQQRKEVIHAKGKAGKKTKLPKRTPWSDISCSTHRRK